MTLSIKICFWICWQSWTLLCNIDIWPARDARLPGRASKYFVAKWEPWSALYHLLQLIYRISESLAICWILSICYRVHEMWLKHYIHIWVSLMLIFFLLGNLSAICQISRLWNSAWSESGAGFDNWKRHYNQVIYFQSWPLNTASF